MRTTLTLDEDVHAIARALAKQRGVPIGQVVSELSRKGLRGEEIRESTRNGLRLFPKRQDAPPVTPDLVKRLLEETD